MKLDTKGIRNLIRSPRILTFPGTHPRSLELPAQLRADAEVVFVLALENLIGRIGAEQPGPINRDLIANAEAILRILGTNAVPIERLHRGHLENELLIEIEEILQAERATECVGAG